MKINNKQENKYIQDIWYDYNLKFLFWAKATPSHNIKQKSSLVSIKKINKPVFYSKVKLNQVFNQVDF